MEKLLEMEEEKRFEEIDQSYKEALHDAMVAEQEYITAKQKMDKYKETMDAAKKTLIHLDSLGIEFDRVSISLVKKKGSVDMKELQRKYDIMDSDLDALRKPSTEYYTVRLKK